MSDWILFISYTDIKSMYFFLVYTLRYDSVKGAAILQWYKTILLNIEPNGSN
jgi:hypothetical protein